MGKRTESSRKKKRERLIRTKLIPPGGFQRVVQRERLRTLLDAAPIPYKLALVTAPAGYGKSTLLTQWLRVLDDRGVATGWLNLEADDNDPVRFVSYLMGALKPVLEARRPDTLTQIRTGWRSVVKPLLMSLARDLQETDDPVALFLDDYDCISDQSVHDALDWLILHSPPQMLFVVASRTETGLTTNSLRLRGELLEVRMEDLSFQLEEAEHFLNELKGHDLEHAELSGLVERTEGWIGGLSLISLALRGARDRRRLIRDFSGSDRAITDYLVETVLNRLKPDMQEFLMVTALLDRMCVDLCREVTGRDDCQVLLDRIEADNLFLLPLDREHKWYRYHHLFADFLRARITARHPKRVRKCCRIASDWFARRGYDSEAIRYGFAAGDLERVADLIENCCEDLVQQRGEHATLLDWMRRLPDTHIEARPRLRIAYAWSLTFTRRYAEAEQELEKLDASPERKTGLASTDPWALRAVEVIRCVLYALGDQTTRCYSASNEWLNRWTEAPWFETGSVCSTLAYTCVARRDFEHGRSALEKARAAFENCSGYYGIAWDDAMEGMILIQEARPREAAAVYRRGLAQAERELGSCSYAESMLSVLLSEALYEIDELEEAKARLDAGFPLVDDHGVVETALAGYVTRGRLLCRQDRCEDMDRGLLEGQHLGERLGLLRLTISLAAERIASNLHCGEVDKAYGIAQAAGFLAPHTRQPWSAAADGEAIRETVQFARARLWTATGELDRAVKTLGGLATRARKRGWHRRLIELLVARTVAYERCGNRKHALRTLDAAVRLAADGGVVRVFLDADAALGDLLEELNEGRSAVPGADEIAVRFLLEKLVRNGSGEIGVVADAAEAPYEAPQADTLTRRETEILRLLAKGLSNQQLASTLFVSETTVKWHLSNVYAKLGVRNRTSAVGQARERSLI